MNNLSERVAYIVDNVRSQSSDMGFPLRILAISTAAASCVEQEKDVVSIVETLASALFAISTLCDEEIEAQKGEKIATLTNEA